jgi:hypothetical protein
VELPVAITEKLLEEFQGQAEVGPFAHAEFERRGQRFNPGCAPAMHGERELGPANEGQDGH